jgi:hypothetical protein
VELSPYQIPYDTSPRRSVPKGSSNVYLPLTGDLRNLNLATHMLPENATSRSRTLRTGIRKSWNFRYNYLEYIPSSSKLYFQSLRMTSYTYTPLALSNVTRRGRHEYKAGLRDGISHMFEDGDAQLRVPPNYEDLVAEASGVSGFMMDIYGLQKFTDRLIRLLILEPGPSTAPICCRLEHCDLREEPQFKALSYVWGPPVDIPEGRTKPISRSQSTSIPRRRTRCFGLMLSVSTK